MSANDRSYAFISNVIEITNYEIVGLYEIIKDVGQLNGLVNEYFVNADSLRIWANNNGVGDPVIQQMANNALTRGRLYISI